jgi:hypothetical protein
LKALFFVLSFLASSCSMIETRKDLDKVMQENMVKVSFVIPKQTFAESDKIMRDFAKTCLSSMLTTQMGKNRQNTATFEDSYQVEYEHDAKSSAIYVKLIQEASNSVHTYILVAKLAVKDKSSTAVDIYHRKQFMVNYENHSVRLKEWLKKEKSLCPSF